MKVRAVKKMTIFTVALMTCSYALAESEPYTNIEQSCHFNQETQQARSKELAELAATDQSDRANYGMLSDDEIKRVMLSDLKQRMRVGELFGDGCMVSSADYMNGAIIYQHGTQPDHFFQAFTWAKRAGELGDAEGKYWAAMAIDRYLVSLGKKQLFGSQFAKKNMADPCICMEPVEPTFPQEMRKEYTSMTLEERYTKMDVYNAKNCPHVECDHNLEPTPKGSIVGFW